MSDTPDHYDGNRCLEVISAVLSANQLHGEEAFILGNVVKYLYRYKRKGGSDDIRKAITYLNFLLDYEIPSDYYRKTVSGQYTLGD